MACTSHQFDRPVLDPLAAFDNINHGIFLDCLWGLKYRGRVLQMGPNVGNCEDLLQEQLQNYRICFLWNVSWLSSVSYLGMGNFRKLLRKVIHQFGMKYCIINMQYLCTICMFVTQLNPGPIGRVEDMT